MKRLVLTLLSIGFLFVLTSLVLPTKASAHCDTINGPVVNAARNALKSKNVNHALIWVKPENEDQIRKALKRALKKRKKAKSKEEKDKVDMEFFETLVKIHRAGEGAPYEGIKKEGSVDKEIMLADKAVDTGNLNEVLGYIKSSENKEIVSHLFHNLKAKSNFDIYDLYTGREYVALYAEFLHAAEKAMKGFDLTKAHLHTH